MNGFYLFAKLFLTSIVSSPILVTQNKSLGLETKEHI